MPVPPVKGNPQPKSNGPTLPKNYNVFQAPRKTEPKSGEQGDHQWKEFKLAAPEFCLACKNAIMTKTSLRCKNCKLHCHEVSYIFNIFYPILLFQTYLHSLLKTCTPPKNCAATNNTPESSNPERVYIRHEKTLSHAFLATIKKETAVSIYLFDDLLCITKPGSNTFNVLHVIKVKKQSLLINFFFFLNLFNSGIPRLLVNP